MKLAAILLMPSALLFGLILLVTLLLGSTPELDSSTQLASSCAPQLPQGRDTLDLDRVQRSSAETIVAVGQGLEVPVRGWVIAVATAMHESGLKPLPYGDRDSLGLFQQRTGWGTEAQRMDPASASRMFYAGGHGGQPGLLDVDGWQGMPLAQAAQSVQVRAYPEAYAHWEPLATALVRRLTDQPVDACGPPGS